MKHLRIRDILGKYACQGEHRGEGRHAQGYWGGFGAVDGSVLGLPDNSYLDKLFHDNKIKLLKGRTRCGSRHAEL